MKLFTLLSISLSFLSLPALADGFLCEGKVTGIQTKLYNHTDPAVGTRTPAVLVLSNPQVQSDRKTIAVFSDQNRTLQYLGRGQYVAKVDLRYLDSGRQGENIAGTKLGELKSISLKVKFAYSHAGTQIANSVDEIPGQIYYLKRNGELIDELAVCKRYRKNN
jgi:hypothetical protein